LGRQKATAADGRHLGLPAADVIDLRNGKAGSLQMVPRRPREAARIPPGRHGQKRIEGIPVGDVITGSVPVADQGRAAAAYAGTPGRKLARVDQTMPAPAAPGSLPRGTTSLRLEDPGCVDAGWLRAWIGFQVRQPANRP
jgi:hypothetical protein